MNQETIEKLKEGNFPGLTSDEAQWLAAQVEKARDYEEWLRKIADLDYKTYTAVDASYWALLALGEV